MRSLNGRIRSQGRVDQIIDVGTQRRRVDWRDDPPSLEQVPTREVLTGNRVEFGDDTSVTFHADHLAGAHAVDDLVTAPA